MHVSKQRLISKYNDLGAKAVLGGKATCFTASQIHNISTYKFVSLCYKIGDSNFPSATENKILNNEFILIEPVTQYPIACNLLNSCLNVLTDK